MYITFTKQNNVIYKNLVPFLRHNHYIRYISLIKDMMRVWTGMKYHIACKNLVPFDQENIKFINNQ